MNLTRWLTKLQLPLMMGGISATLLFLFTQLVTLSYVLNAVPGSSVHFTLEHELVFAGISLTVGLFFFGVVLYTEVATIGWFKVSIGLGLFGAGAGIWQNMHDTGHPLLGLLAFVTFLALAAYSWPTQEELESRQLALA